MAKELPYFKFECSEWDNGNIQMCSLEAKGLFIDICSTYWTRLGELSYALALQKHCKGDTKFIKELIDSDVIVISSDKTDMIVIEFLDEQLNEFQDTSKKRTDAANKRWDKCKSNAKAIQVHSKSNAIREDKIKKEKNIVKREIKFRDSLTSFVETYGEKMIKKFYDHWREPNRSKSKMRWEQQDTWELGLRLKKWENNNDRWTK